MIGRHSSLFEQRRNQAVTLAAMLYAFAYSVDTWIIGLHGIVDDYAALTIYSGLLRKLDRIDASFRD
jgi:hypothetical protein